MQIVTATPKHLAELAPKIGLDPLFIRYALTPAMLAASWIQGLERGEGMLVAVDEDGPQGLAWFVAKGAFCRGAYLRLLAVAPAIQAQGTGQRLLAAFEAACQPAAGGWSLLCSDFNTRAHSFYTAHGYLQVGRLPGFVLPDVAEVLFYKARAQS